MKILLLGGYGRFGGRLVQLLDDLDRLEIFIAGRDGRKAEKFCSLYTGKSKLYPLQLDRSKIDVAMSKIKPDLIVDASGPFQNYREKQWDIVRVAINNRVNYLDFSDASTG